jgi:hypothetical protein
MKKSAFPVAALLLGVLLSGCPIYDSDGDGCFDSSDCRAGYVCDTRTSLCVSEQPGPATCQRPGDCGANETCGKSATCVPGDCHFSSVGCVKGYVCSPDSGRWECVRTADTGSGGDSGTGPGSQGGQTDGGAAGAEAT